MPVSEPEKKPETQISSTNAAARIGRGISSNSPLRLTPEGYFPRSPPPMARGLRGFQANPPPSSSFRPPTSSFRRRPESLFLLRPRHRKGARSARFIRWIPAPVQARGKLCAGMAECAMPVGSFFAQLWVFGVFAQTGKQEWREFCSRRLFLGYKRRQFSSPRLRNGLSGFAAYETKSGGARQAAIMLHQGQAGLFFMVRAAGVGASAKASARSWPKTALKSL